MKKGIILAVVMLLTAAWSMASYNNAPTSDEPTTPQEGLRAGERSEGMGKTVIVYFSKTVPDGVDATTGATPTATYKGQTMGATQYVATLVQEQTGADVQRIMVADDHYPVEYTQMADQAREERDNNVHPPLTSTHDLSQYQNVIIGMPVWWFTMPMPMYSFFDAVNLSGKNVYIFTTHAGSGLNNNPQRVKELEPDAIVSTDGWASNGEQVAQNASTVTTWLQRIGLYKDPTGMRSVTVGGMRLTPAYDLQGRPAVEGYKGIVVKDGRKFMQR